MAHRYNNQQGTQSKRTWESLSETSQPLKLKIMNIAFASVKMNAKVIVQLSEKEGSCGS